MTDQTLVIRRAVTAALAVVALAMLAVGCGGSDSSASSTSTSDSGTTVSTVPLTKAQFVKQANAICEPGRTSLGPALGTYIEKHSPANKPVSEKLVAEGMRVVFLPRVESQTVRISKLKAPVGDEGQVEAFLVSMRQSANTLEETKNLKSVAQLEAIFRSAGRLARKYGLQSCAYAMDTTLPAPGTE